MAHDGGPSSQSEDSVFRRIWEMWRDVWSTDVHLECEDFVFPVHSVILAASSKYFRMKLTSKTPSSKIVITGIPVSVLTQILIFMYKGTLRLPCNATELRSLLHGAHTLQVHDLCRDIHLFFSSIINCNNYQDLWTLADEYSNERCMKIVLDFVISNYTQVWIHPNFFHLSAKQILGLANHPAIARVSHTILHQSIREWTAKNDTLTNYQKFEFEHLLQDLADRDFTAEDCFYFGDKVPNSQRLLKMDGHMSSKTSPSGAPSSQLRESYSKDEDQPKIVVNIDAACGSHDIASTNKSEINALRDSLDELLFRNKVQPCGHDEKATKLNHKTLRNMVYIMTNSGVDIERVMGTEAFTELLQYIEQQDRDMARGFTEILHSETIRKKAYGHDVLMHGIKYDGSTPRTAASSAARSEEVDSAVLQGIANSSKALVSSNPETLYEIITPLRRPASHIMNSERDVHSPQPPFATTCCCINQESNTLKTCTRSACDILSSSAKDTASQQLRSENSTCQAKASTALCPMSFKTLGGAHFPRPKAMQLLNSARPTLRIPTECTRMCTTGRSIHVPLLELSTLSSTDDDLEHKPVADNVLSWKRENGVIRVTTGCQTSPRIVRFNCRRFLRAMAYQVNEIMYAHDQNNERRFTVPQELFKGFSLHQALSWTRSPRPRNQKTMWSASTENLSDDDYCDQGRLVNTIKQPVSNNHCMLTTAGIRSCPIDVGDSHHPYNASIEKIQVIEYDEDSYSNTNDNTRSRSGTDSRVCSSSSVLSSLAAGPSQFVTKKRSCVTVHSSPTKTLLKIPSLEKSLNFSDSKTSDSKSVALPEVPSSSAVFTKLKLAPVQKYEAVSDDDERSASWTTSRPVDVYSGSPRREVVIAVIGRKKHGEVTMLYFNADLQKWIFADNLQQILKSVGYELLEKSCCVSCNQTVYLIGGLDNQETCRSTVLALSPDCYPRACFLESLQVPRHSAGSVLFQKHIYVLGGISTNGRLLNHMERYSIVKNKWRTMPPLPTCGWGMSLVVAGQYLFSIGGRRHSEWTLDCFKYDPVEQQWTRMCKIPSEFSLCHAHAVFCCNRVYAFRHYNPCPKGNTAILNPHVMMWLVPETVGQLPPKRVVTAFVWEKKVWVVDTAAHLFKFDPSTLKWEADYPFFRSMARPLYTVLIARSMESSDSMSAILS